MAALIAQAAADAHLSSLMRNMADITSCQTFILFYQLTLRIGVREIRSVLKGQLISKAIHGLLTSPKK